MTTVLSNIETKKKKRYDVGYYSVTLNTDERHQFCGRLDRLNAFHQFMHSQLVVWRELGIQYKFCIELSDVWEIKPLSIGSRLHLHGIVHLKDTNAVFNFLAHVQYQQSRQSYMEIDTISDPDVWITYCEKQNHIMGTFPLLSSNEALFDECKKHYLSLNNSDIVHEDVSLHVQKEIVVDLQDPPAEGAVSLLQLAVKPNRLVKTKIKRKKKELIEPEDITHLMRINDINKGVLKSPEDSHERINLDYD